MIPTFTRTLRVAPPTRGLIARVATAISALSILLWAAPAAGQDGGTRFPAPDRAAFPFSDETVTLQTIGLRLEIPVGAESFVAVVDRRLAAGVRLGDSLGTVRMHARLTNGRDKTALDLEREALLRSAPEGLRADAIPRDMQFTIDGVTGLGRGAPLSSAGTVISPFYIGLDDGGGDSVMGLAVLPLNPNAHVVYELETDRGSFEQARQAFELMLMSAEMTRRQEVAGPTFAPPDEGVVTFSDRTVELESVGLRMGIPEGGEGFIETIGGRPTAGVLLPDRIGTVLMQSREMGGATRSVLDLEKAVLRRTLLRSLNDERINIDIDLIFETSAGVSMGRSPALPSAGRIVRPFYVRLTEDSPEPMRGFGVIPIDPETFVLFQLVCADDDFEIARQAFELCLRSASLEEGEEIDDERASRIGAGRDALSGLTADDYAAVIEDFPDQFERIYRPAPGGAVADEEEVGYRRVRAWRGTLADVERGEPDPTSRAAPTGYLLRLDGSVLLDDGFGGVSRADSRAVYYLSADRKQESWKVDMSIHTEGDPKPEVWSELGVRVGDTMSVQITNANRESSTIRPSIRGDGYVSRLESSIMPQLLIRAEAEGAFAFYAYDQAAEVNRLRTVTASRAADRPDLWRIRTELSSDQWEASEFNSYGRLIRSETSDGLVKRPIEFERLYAIWNAKGLPLD